MVIASPKGDPRGPLSVSQVNALLNQAVERALPRVEFVGEISELTMARSGHLYMTIRDVHCQLPAIMWQTMVRTLSFHPKVGMQVECIGKPVVYQKQGRLQIIVNRMRPAGDGHLQLKFEQLKAKLEREGLFAAERKRPIPFFPSAIGIVTSAGGAAIHDIMHRIRDRMPCLCVYLYDAKVQGEGAAEEIARGIEAFNRHGQVEVIVVSRGGGSLEDLWAFNEERVARAVFASAIPVISAVGHDVDVTLSDLAADLRAPTPTAAGEMVVPRRDDLLRTIGELQSRLENLDRWFYPRVQAFDDLALRLEERMERLLERFRLLLSAREGQLERFRPDRRLAVLAGILESRERDLRARLSDRIGAAREQIARLEARLDRAVSPESVAHRVERVSFWEGRLSRAVAQVVRQRGRDIATLNERLVSASPMSVLRRGYALVSKDGRYVRAAGDLQGNDSVQLTFADGMVEAEISESREDERGASKRPVSPRGRNQRDVQEV